MAMKMFDNLNAIVANTLTDSIKMIDIDELHESTDNFFNVERIDEFAETILGQGGVKDNLIVTPLETGGYEIISGHRRKAAVQYLLDKGEDVSRYLPCLVQEYSNDSDKKIDLVLMNISTRQISDSELWQSYETLNAILKEKKNSGEKFGRIRDKLSELLGVSPAQVGKIQNIENNAIDEVKEAVQNGDITISTANEIAKLDDEAQQELTSSDLNEVTHKEVKKLQKERKRSAVAPKQKETANDFDDKSESDFSFSDKQFNEIEEEQVIGTPTVSKLESFIKKNYTQLEAILDEYENCVDSDYELLTIEKFKDLLSKHRNKF